MQEKSTPALLILNQMAGPMTWELAEDLGNALGSVALLTGHPDTLQKEHPNVQLFAAKAYERGTFAQRAITWLHYCWQAFWWIWRWPKTTPLLLFSNPPILVWLGYLVSLLRGQRYAVMVHDIYPDILERTNVVRTHHPLARIWRWCNRQAYERAEVVMTLGEYMAETLAQQFDPAQTAHGRIEVIPPWVDTNVIRPIPKAENWFAQEHGLVNKLAVMYSGNMGLGHDIETMVAAAKLLRGRDDIHFMFIGAGPKWQVVDEAIKSDSLSNVTLLGWQPEEVIPYSLAAADVALVSLEPEFEGIMVPSKGGYSMAAGSALVLLSEGKNELRRWIDRFGCGATVATGDADELARTLMTLVSQDNKLTEYQNRSHAAAQQAFSRAVGGQTILAMIPTTVGDRFIDLASSKRKESLV